MENNDIAAGNAHQANFAGEHTGISEAGDFTRNIVGPSC